MRKNFAAKTWYTLCRANFGTYDKSGAPGAMNAAWDRIYDTNMLMPCIVDYSKTSETIKSTAALTVYFTTTENVVPRNYVNIVSGNDVPNKFAKSGFHTNMSKYVNDIFMDVIHEYPDLTVHLTLFNATIAKGEPQKIEHNDIRWIAPSEISNYNFCPADEEILKRIKACCNSRREGA